MNTKERFAEELELPIEIINELMHNFTGRFSFYRLHKNWMDIKRDIGGNLVYIFNNNVMINDFYKIMGGSKPNKNFDIGLVISDETLDKYLFKIEWRVK